MRPSNQLLFVAPVLALAMLPGAATAATITVDTTADVIDASGDCSLREAVIAANTNAAVDGCTAGELGATDEIVLGAGTYTLVIDGVDETWEPGSGEAPYDVVDSPDPTVGDIDVTESLNLTGAGSDLTILEWGGTVDDRVLHIAPPAGGSATVTLQGLTIQYGAVHAQVINPEDPELEQWLLRRFGGGVAAGAGAGTKQVGTSGPSDEGGPSDEEEGGFGDVSLYLDDVRFYGNYAGGDAGGLFAGDVTATNVVFEANITDGNGGGAYGEGTVTMTGVAFVDNTAEGGGAMFLTGPTHATFDSLELSGNYAIGGGGLSFRSLVELDLVNCVVVGNEAFDVGGGLYGNGSANLYNCTVVGNLAGGDASFGGGGLNSFGGGTFQMVNTLLADNVAGSVDANCGCTGGSCTTNTMFSSWGYNLEDADTCALDATGDLIATEPLIGPLGAYGGPVGTVPLLAGSPALDSAGADHCPELDARTVPRPIGGACDIGAFELSVLERDADLDGSCPGLEIGGELWCSDGSFPGDCDDTEPASFPGNPEICDAIDNDCANGIDDGLPFDDWYLDVDRDGFGDAAYAVSTCDGPPDRHVADSTDCDDLNSKINPDADEVCNEIDDDCDALSDDDDDSVDLSTGTTWYVDGDDDGFGDEADGLDACAQPEGRVDDATDCDDADAAINPDADEIRNDIDDDCDGLVDRDDDNFVRSCGCSTATNGPSFAFAILLGLAGLIRRRRA